MHEWERARRAEQKVRRSFWVSSFSDGCNRKTVRGNFLFANFSLNWDPWPREEVLAGGSWCSGGGGQQSAATLDTAKRTVTYLIWLSAKGDSRIPSQIIFLSSLHIYVSLLLVCRPCVWNVLTLLLSCVVLAGCVWVIIESLRLYGWVTNCSMFHVLG